MLEVISHTPNYVWPLLAYLFWGGWKSRKTNVTPWRRLLIMPAVMFVWSVYSISTHYSPVAICFWALSITLGIWLGSLTVRGMNLRFDKNQHLIEIAGNWAPMMLSMSIFALRYFLGVTYGLHSELAGSPILFILENFATVISGMFLGRLIGYWQRSKIAPHSDLAQLKT